MTVDQQIRFKECPHDEPPSASTSVLRVSRSSGVYRLADETLRFGSQASVYNANDAQSSAERNNVRLLDRLIVDRRNWSRLFFVLQNPCLTQYQICSQPHMLCQPEGRQYRCICEAGFEYIQDDSVETRFRCVGEFAIYFKLCERAATFSSRHKRMCSLAVRSKRRLREYGGLVFVSLPRRL